MTLYLHIGIGKTGTTTLQVFLEANRAELRRRGLLVSEAPRSRNHRALAMYALDDESIDNSRRAKGLTRPDKIAGYRTRLRGDLVAEAETMRPGEDIVFSSEQLTRVKRPAELARLKELLEVYGRDIKIVTYLRRQDLYFVSEYSQLIKGGQTIEMVADETALKRSVYNYWRFLKGWADTFGKENVIVRPFERAVLKDGDIIADFCAVIGLADVSDLPRPAPQNESLDQRTIEYLRMLNPSIPRFLGRRPNPARQGLVEAMEKLSDGPKVRLSHPEAVRFLAMFDESNAAVARTYLGREDGVLFVEKPGMVGEKRPALTLEQAMEISGKLWNHTATARIGQAKRPKRARPAT